MSIIADKTALFIEQATAVHGNKYDYSQSQYTRSDKHVAIICDHHGLFYQTPYHHIRGRHCVKCAQKQSQRTQSIKKSSNSTEFIRKARMIHGNTYDYSKVIYVNARTKIKIICPEHGSFFQTPGKHLYDKNGCTACGINRMIVARTSTTDEFIQKSRQIHGSTYDYSSVKYENALAQVCIKCHTHGIFLQTPGAHLEGAGCEKCHVDSLRLGLDEFIRRSRIIHGDRYDYSKSRYTNKDAKILIICPEHGEFEQSSSAHLRGCGCPLHNKTVVDTKSFIATAREIHNNKFDYSNVDYVSAKTYVQIVCPIHGTFQQTPDSHVNRQNGCPKCPVPISKSHQTIMDYLTSLGVVYEENDRTVLDGLEIDVWMPQHRIGIEIHGEYWHGLRNNNRDAHNRFRTLHVRKADAALLADASLLQFWDSEIEEKSEIVKSIIRSKLGICKVSYARKSTITVLTPAQSTDFFNTSHLAGNRHASVSIGLVANGAIQCALSLSRHAKYEWEIIRFANKLGTTTVGGFARLLNHFVRTYNPTSIMTFADRRISTGLLYVNNGFRIVNTTKPNYFYRKSRRTLSRQQCQKHKLHKLLGDTFDNSLSEKDNMLLNGWSQIHDAGHLKFAITL